MGSNIHCNHSSYCYNFNGDIIMRFSSDLLDEYAEREGYVDWELVPLTDESPYWGDTLIRFIND